MSAFERLLKEVHRRSLWQVLLIYVGASWAVIEAVQGLTEATGLPGWFPSFAVGLLLIGFPVVMATAFVQHGIGGVEGRRDRETEAEPATKASSDPAVGSVRAVEPAPAATSAHRLLTWRNAVGGGVMAMALWGVLATGWILTGQPTGLARGGGGGSGIALATVAVLPFENMSPDEDNAFFAAGIHEDILTQLSKIAALTVISRTSVMPYAETDKSLRQIGEELRAGAILEGSVRRAGNQVRITTQLIDSRNDAHLWAQTYDRELDDVFRIQTEIATHVAEALEATLSPDEEARIAASPTADLEAYDIYLRGRELYNEYNVEANEAAIELFGQAIALDPDFALAWAGLGDAYAQAYTRFGREREYGDSAVAAARNAVRLGPELGDAHKALGLALAAMGRRDEALQTYFRSAELNPSNFAVVNNIGTIVSTRGELDEALVWYRRSARIAPNEEFPRTNAAELYTLLGDFETADDWLTEAERDFPEGLSVYQTRAFWHLFQGEGQAAYDAALSMLRIAPQDPYSQIIVGIVALWTDRLPEAVEHLGEASDLAPGGHWAIHDLELLYAAALVLSGRAQEAEAHLAREEDQLRTFRGEGETGGFIDYDLAAAAALRGDRDGAIAHLHEAVERKWFFDVVPDDPVFVSLHQDAEYQAIMAQVQTELARMRNTTEARERAEGIR